MQQVYIKARDSKRKSAMGAPPSPLEGPGWLPGWPLRLPAACRWTRADTLHLPNTCILSEGQGHNESAIPVCLLTRLEGCAGQGEGAKDNEYR